jgi:16S rRNA (guanine(966)-N(2))-methyltransferase RsmD
MRTQLRIVAGTLRGRKLTCSVNPKLRPAPQMVREALFSILGNAVPERPFFDLFAGTGAIGLEALSRGATEVTLVERDFRVAAEIERHASDFGVADQVKVLRADVYRWAERWSGAALPVNLFLGPPYPDLERQSDELLELVECLDRKLASESVLVVQAEESPGLVKLQAALPWDLRRYGRNLLLFSVKP